LIREIDGMQVESQAEAIAFLTDPASHGFSGMRVSTIGTHISLVVLAGNRAYKLKRAVRLPYVDFSTAERRLSFCERELLLNRRTVPELYRAVRRITREADGRLAFDGRGPTVDAVVEMVRFDQDTLFDRMAERGALTTALLTELAHEVARFHETAAVDHAGSGAANIAGVLSINERALAGTKVFPADAVAGFNRAFRQTIAGHQRRLDARQRAGKVRHCHGDLHLRNICLFKGHPALFDCLEFNDAMATVDVLYDLAFLLMDLWHRDLKAGANLVLNRYLDVEDESDSLALVPPFMAIRAAVRAHVTATKADEPTEAANATALQREASTYFDLALRLLRPVPPRLVAIGGLSGSGKSTVAAAIASYIGPPPGARVLTSDRIRKRISGVPPATRLPQSQYRPEVSETVYATLAREAEHVLALGHGVVLDAVHDRAEDRARLAAIAEAVGVPFAGIWLDAPPEALFARVEARRGDPSDATAAVVRAQIERFKGPVEWRHVDAAGNVGETCRRTLAAIDQG
jgi:hypothetical protein